MHHLPVDHYSRLASPIHRLDARAKVAATVLFIALESNLPRLDLWGALTLGLLPLLLAALSEVPCRHFASRLLLASPFILFVAAFQPFLAAGAEGWHLGISAAGLLAAMVLLAKFAADVLMTLVLVTTTPFEELAGALRCFRAPVLLVELLVMTFRYTFVLADELERMVRTARLRAVAAAGLRRRIYAYSRIIGTHLLRSFDRAERVYQAMLLRGFRQRLGWSRRRRLAAADVAFMASSALFITGIFAWRLMSK